MVKNNRQNRDSPGCSPPLVEVLRLFATDYRERLKRYNQRGPCPVDPGEAAKWTRRWEAEDKGIWEGPYLWLCERIVNLTGVDDDFDFNDVKEGGLRLASGWHLYKSLPAWMPGRRVPPKVTEKLCRLDRDGLSGPIIRELVEKYADHDAVAKFQMEFPQLVRRAKTSGGVRRIGSWVVRHKDALILLMIGALLTALVAWLGLG